MVRVERREADRPGALDKNLPSRPIDLLPSRTIRAAADVLDVREIPGLGRLASGVPQGKVVPPGIGQRGRDEANPADAPQLDGYTVDTMRPSDPNAVSKRFAAVLARGLARADVEMAEHYARLRALPTEEKRETRPPWVKGRPGSRGSRKATRDAWLDEDL